MTEEKLAYGQVLRTSSIIGGVQALNYVIGFARVKIVALLIGPAGVGLFGVYTSAITLVGTVSDLGVGPNVIREVARVNGVGDAAELARAINILRKILCVTGVLGWTLTVLLCEPLSLFMTGDPRHAQAIAFLGSILLLNAINVGQLGLLQGMRRMGDLARANLSGALLSSLAAILIFWFLGEAGVAPSMIVAGLVTLCCSFWYARRVALTPTSVTWRESWIGFRRIAGLGGAFLWCGLLANGLDMLVRALITRSLGIDAAGIYQAGWTLSGVFANVVIAAMATDYYPRLVAAINDKSQAARAINQQTEIGVLLALPGLLFASASAPFIVRIVYSSEFLPAAELLPWMAVGVFSRVVCWPLWYVQIAKGAVRWFVVTQTLIVALQAGLTLVMLPAYGLVGAAYAFAITYVAHTIIMLYVARALLGLSWSAKTYKLIFFACGLVGMEILLRLSTNDFVGIVGGGLITLLGVLFSLKGLADRLDEEHRLIKLLHMAPGGQFLFAASAQAQARELRK